MKKRIIALFVILLLVTSIVLATFLFLTGSSKGLSWLFSNLKDSIPGNCQIGKIGGSLYGTLNLKDVSYKNDLFNLEISELLIVWSPDELFSSKLHIKNCELTKVVFEQFPQKSPVEEKKKTELKLDLPDIELPISIILDSFKITDVKIISPDSETPIDVNSAELKASFDEKGLTIKKFNLDSLQVTADIKGRLEPIGSYKLSFKNQIILKVNDIPEVNLTGTVEGDLDRLIISQQSGGAADISLDSDISLKELSFIASLKWDSLKWPLSDKPEFISEKGSVKVKGKADDYEFEVATLLKGKEIPEGSWEVKGNGSLSSANIEKLQGKIMEGFVDLSALVSWKSGVSWESDIKVQGINPSNELKELKDLKKLDLIAHLKGNFDDKLVLDTDLNKLRVLIEEHEIEANGKFSMNGQDLTFDNITVSTLSKPVICLNGIASETLDLNLNMDIDKIGDFLPGASGELDARVSIRGTRSLPSAQGDFSIHNFQYKDKLLKKLESDFSYNSSGKKPSFFELKVHDIKAENLKVKKTVLSVKGSMDKHDIHFSTETENEQLGLAASGKYDLKKSLWDGLLKDVNILTDEFGSAHLKNHVPLQVSKDTAKWKNLCLEKDKTTLCTTVDWHSDIPGNATLTLKDFDLKAVKQFLPSDISEINGTINADSTIHLQGSNLETVSSKVDLSKGNIKYFVEENGDINVEFRKGLAEAILDDQKLKMDFFLDSYKNRINGSIMLPRSHVFSSPEKAPLNGHIKIDIGDIGLLALFIPGVKKTQGEIKADIKINGVAGNPELHGTAMIQAHDTAIPLAGIKIDKTEIRFNSKGNTIFIDGDVSSDGSNINLLGSFRADPESGWPAEARIKGEHFRLLNVPDVVLFISPDINIESASKKIQISGTVTVPKAEILPRQIPANIKKKSQDIVIVKKGEEKSVVSQGPFITARITLKLLEDVHLKGFGLDCYLTGELTVIQEPGTQPRGSGELRIIEGSLHVLGKDLEIQKGIISYAGGRMDNPGISLIATRDIQGVNVGVEMTGTLNEPIFSGYSSDSSISSQDAITMLLTGKTKKDPEFQEASTRNAAIAGADLVAGELGRYAGLDHLSVTGAGDNSEDTRVFAGQDITKDITIGVETGTDEDGTQFVARFKLWRKLNLEVKSGSDRSGLNLLYIIKYQ